MKKRFLAILLMLAMLVSMIPAVALPAAAELTHDESIADGSVYVGGVKMEDKTYLPVGSTTPVTEKPEGGYAYVEFTSGRAYVTLNNYSYEGEGFTYNTADGTSAVIFANLGGGLVVEAQGQCSLTNTKDGGAAIVNTRYHVFIEGYFYMTLDADYGIVSPTTVDYDIEGTMSITNAVFGVVCKDFQASSYGDGRLKITASDTAIQAKESVSLYFEETEIVAGKKGVVLMAPIDEDEDIVSVRCKVKITAGECAVSTPSEIYISNWEAELEATVTDEGAVALVGDLNIYDLHPLSFGASADSLLVTDVVYDPSNATHQAYKTASYVHVAPHPANGAAGENVGASVTVAGVTMTDGDYLANDATAATKDQPAEGGYAYYKGGVLTLHDYRHVSAGTTADNEMGGGGMLDEYASTALIHTEYSLVLLLEGESYLENTNKEYGSLVTVEDGDLTVKGDGMLEGKSAMGLMARDNRLFVSDVTLKLYVLAQPYSDYSGRALSGYNGMDILNAKIEIECEGDDHLYALEAFDNLFMDGTTISCTSPDNAEGWAFLYAYDGAITNSEVTVTNMEVGISGITYIADSKINMDVAYIAFNGSGDGVSLMNCDLELKSDDCWFADDVSAIGCTLKGSCDGEVVSSGDDLTLINSDMEVATEHFFYDDIDITVSGGSLAVSSDSFAYLGDDYDIITRNTDFIISYGASAGSLTVDEQPFDFAAQKADIKDASYVKLVAVEEAPALTVGGIGLADGEYLANGATEPTTEKPNGGYAYYKDGTLTLKDFYHVYAGPVDVVSGRHTIISTYKPLTVILEGESQMREDGDYTDTLYGIYCASDLTVRGSGKLTDSDTNLGLLYAKGNILLEGATIEGDAGHQYGIIFAEKNLTINGGSYENVGLMAYKDVLIHDGVLDLWCIMAGEDMTVNGGKISVICQDYNNIFYVEHGYFILNGGEVYVKHEETGVVVECGNIIVNGGSLKLEADTPIYTGVSILSDSGSVPQFLGGSVELISTGGKVIGFFGGSMAKIANCRFTAKGLLVEPDFDLSEYGVFEAIYSQNNDYSDTKPYEEGLEYVTFFSIKPAGSISFNAGGGDGEMAALTEVSGNVALPECTFTAPTGKIFKGWSLTENGELLSDTVYVDGDITLFAVWEDDPGCAPETESKLPDGSETSDDPHDPDHTTPSGDPLDPDPSDPDDPKGDKGDKDDKDDKGDKDGLSVGAVIGIAVAVGAVFGGGGFAGCWFMMRNRSAVSVDPAPASAETPKAEQGSDDVADTEATDAQPPEEPNE